MNKFKKLAGDTAIYGISSIAGRMLSYFLVPYYTRELSTGEFGVVTHFYAFAAFLSILYVYGMETAYFRFASKKGVEEKTVFNTATSSIIVSSFLLSFLFYWQADWFAHLIGYPDNAEYVKWFSVIFAIDAVVAIPFAQLRFENKAKQFARTKLLNIGINVGLNVFFITICPLVLKGNSDGIMYKMVDSFYVANWDIEYIFISNLIANGAFLLLLRSSLLKIKFSIKWKLLKPMLVYAFPILITGLAFATNEMLSRAVLKFWLPEGFYPGQSTEDALGVFGAVFKLSIFMNLGIQAFRYAAEPFFFKQAEDKKAPKLFADVMLWYVIIGLLVCLGVSLNLDWIVLILGKEFRVGVGVVPVLLLANFFFGMYYNLSIWYKLSDKTYFGTIITVFGAAITFVLNYLWIPLFGYMGSAYAALVSVFAMVLLSYILSRKHYVIPYRIVYMLPYGIAAIFLLLLNQFYLDSGSLTDFALKQILLLIFVIWIVFRENVIQKIKAARSKKRDIPDL